MVTQATFGAISFFKMIYNNLKFFVKRAVYPVAVLLLVTLPITIYILIKTSYEERGYFAVGGEMIIPIAIVVFYFFVCYSRASKRSYGIPIPEKRYTKESDNGDVYINKEQVYDVIIYLSDLEDYLERNGLLKSDSED